MKLRIKPRRIAKDTTVEKDTTPTRKPYDKATKTRVLKAIPGSGGIIARICKRLDCSRSTLKSRLELPDWDDVRAEMDLERDAVGDIAERTVQESMRQRLDIGTAARTAKWYLERKHEDRGYKDRKELTIEGGNNPLQINSTNVVFLDTLDLDINTRREILKAIKEKEAQIK